MNPFVTATPSSASAARAPVGRLRSDPPRRGLVVAFALSVLVHLAVSYWPAEMPVMPETAPLQATITELPPPPKPAPVAAARPRPKPQRATAPPSPVASPEPAPVAARETPLIEPTPEAMAAGPAPAVEAVDAQPASATPEPAPKMLPPRVDLVYKAFLGTQGFLVGEAAYRFEHAANEYRIATVGEAKGLAALFVRGQGRLESRGLITAAGLQPLEFSVERGSRERRETAAFDWEAGVVTLHEQKTAPLEVPTFDPLALMWQAYFQPPANDTQDLTVATTRRVAHYTVTREGTETIRWPAGEIATERWHRRSEDGKTDAYFWLAPSLHYVPVKIRVTTTFRGILEATLEARLDSIRVDESGAPQ